MSIALTEGEGSSYMDSICVLLTALFGGCSSLIFALLLCKMITMAVVRITTLAISATTRALMVARYAVLVHMSTLLLSCGVVVCTLIGSLTLLTRLPHATVCIANVHTLFSAGTSVQVTLVWLVVVGQLPQFDARIL